MVLQGEFAVCLFDLCCSGICTDPKRFVDIYLFNDIDCFQFSEMRRLDLHCLCCPHNEVQFIIGNMSIGNRNDEQQMKDAFDEFKRLGVNIVKSTDLVL